MLLAIQLLSLLLIAELAFLICRPEKHVAKAQRRGYAQRSSFRRKRFSPKSRVFWRAPGCLVSTR